MLFLLVNSFAQKKEIKSSDDYIILNKTIKKYFIAKKKRDSLYFTDISNFLKDSAQAKKIRRHKKRRKKLDTLHIKAIADKIIYKQFFEKDAKWKRNKYYKKHLHLLNNIFSKEEIEHYNKQLESNDYLWDENKISFEDLVFVNNGMRFTREEIDNLPEDKKMLELKKTFNLEGKLNLYTFSKPIYSINNNYALIAYEKGGTRILNIFEKLDDHWNFKYSINNNIIISRVGY